MVPNLINYDYLAVMFNGKEITKFEKNETIRNLLDYLGVLSEDEIKEISLIPKTQSIKRKV